MEGWTAQLDGVVTPYNEEKYKALLERLEISEVLLSSLRNVETFRFDSDYFSKKYLKINKIIESNRQYFTSFTKLGLKIDASAFYPSLEPYYNQGSIPFVRVADVDNFINYDSCVKIPKKILQSDEFATLKTISKGDIVITKGGSIGRVSLIEKTTAVTRDLIFVNSSLLCERDCYFLYIYLNTTFCYNLMLQSSSMTAQPHLTLTLIKNIPIFNPSNEIKEKIYNLLKVSITKREKSKSKYLQAETLLLETLGLTGFQPNSEPINIKSFKDSFLSTGRLDAEYYQKRYDNYLELIQNYSNGFSLLTFVCELKDKNYNPEENKEYKYIELANIGTSGDITGCSISKGIDLPSRARRLVKTNDVVISSIEGSLESCALVTEEYNNALCSTGFYVINSKQINSETLLVLFKSEPMQNILKQNCSGTILTAINKTEFQNIPIPLIKKDVQKEIKDKISESFRLKKESEQLLETAKRAVEIAIEQDENAALQFIESANS